MLFFTEDEIDLVDRSTPLLYRWRKGRRKRRPLFAGGAEELK